MSSYYLRVEAINFGNFVLDTPDLSTVRGGGLLLLNAVENLAHLVDVKNFHLQTSGASVGLYVFEADDDKKAEFLCAEVKKCLSRDSELQHGTFAVSVQPKKSASTFARDMAALHAKIRWQQMQTASLALSTVKSNQVCEIDLVRPATRNVPAPENKTYAVSESVAVRRLAGQALKQKFYEEQIGRPLQRSFSHELQELTVDKSKGNLNEKMAVIYIDGNGFGAIKKSVRENPEEWLNFDRTVKAYRRAALEKLLEQMEVDKNWQTRDGKYRIETLLWGGDELMWIVPAWKGWETLQNFYTLSESWRFNNISLRHSAGLVFCHHNAPIHRIRKLAEDLSTAAKEDGGRGHNRFAYEVLESFDHIGRDLQRYRKERSPQPLSPTASASPLSLILGGESMSRLRNFVYKYADQMPRKQLHEINLELLTPLGKSPLSVAQRQKRRETMLEQLRKAALRAGIDETELNGLQTTFGGPETLWLHLNALWDYLV